MSMRQLKITKSITNRESQSLEKYLQEIGKVELITPEEEVRLASLIKQGNKEALDRLTKANLRFVVSVAKQYQGQGQAGAFDTNMHKDVVYDLIIFLPVQRGNASALRHCGRRDTANALIK